MKISRFTFNLFAVNTYVMWDADTREAAIVDPGMTDKSEFDAVDSLIAHEKLVPKYLLNTHMHLDHIFGNLYIKEKYRLDIRACKADEFLGKSLSKQVRLFHISIPVSDHGIDIALKDRDILYLGQEPIEVIAVPGHSPGGVSFYCPESAFVISGDTLFHGSIGRTDLSGGDFTALIDSVRRRLLTLPPDTVVLPGHGPETTIGAEASSNPYIG